MANRLGDRDVGPQATNSGAVVEPTPAPVVLVGTIGAPFSQEW